ncbi:MAG: hypothetical protein IPP93_09190 [Chitinophagaceae bacterium]|nr:hypothetical protein [Chitinophagaceae bacterium]MBL0335844.1 hypothetical protein [Chitinophagaceae bacterium]
MKSTGNSPQAVLGIAHAEYYMTALNISSIPVKSPVTIAVPLPEIKPTSGWIVNEVFKNNDNKWRVDSNSKLKCSIDFGYYLNSNTPEQNIVLHTFNMPGNETHDYKIETTLQNFDQKDNSPFGLVFGNHDQHAYYFLITNNGSFAIKETTDTGVVVLKNFTLSSAVHATRNELSFYNKLTIIKLKQTWSFRVNDKEVFTCNAGRLGENFGYWIPGKALIRVRTFKIFDWTLAENFPDQPKEVIYTHMFYDQLWTNINNWDELNNTTTKSSFPYLGYRIEHKGDGYFMPALAMPGMGLTDFKFEVQASHQNGATDKQFGLCFGKKDIDNTYIFTIASDGSYEIGKFINGDWTSIYKGDAAAIYKNNYSTNTLSVEQANGKWFFYINYQLVHTFYSATLPGSKAGCYVEGDQTVQFENMTFSLIEYRDN